MNRDDATAIVRMHICLVDQYQGVPVRDACRLLGSDRFNEMLDDPIKRHGPTTEHVYPWNVIDYLCGYVRPRIRLRNNHA